MSAWRSNRSPSTSASPSTACRTSPSAANELIPTCHLLHACGRSLIALLAVRLKPPGLPVACAMGTSAVAVVHAEAGLPHARLTASGGSVISLGCLAGLL